uniref:Uncharacterized protein n=1 Tax=Panagrolaimus sp. JU765 TaxID=591449 RepID=A0AC34PZ66_9BILA
MPALYLYGTDHRVSAVAVDENDHERDDWHQFSFNVIGPGSAAEVFRFIAASYPPHLIKSIVVSPHFDVRQYAWMKSAAFAYGYRNMRYYGYYY